MKIPVRIYKMVCLMFAVFSLARCASLVANGSHRVGIKQLYAGNFNKAIWYYSEAIKRDPDNAEYYYYRSAAYLGLGRVRESIDDLDFAILLDPGNWEFYNSRGLFYVVDGEFVKALENYNTAINLNPNIAIAAYINRGDLYSKFDRTRDALDDLNRAVSMDPEQYGAYANRSTVYRKIGLYAEALVDINIAIAIKPDDSSLCFLRGLIYLSLEDYGNALADYNKSIKLYSKSASVYKERGELYQIIAGKTEDADLKNSYHEKAATDFETYEKLKQDNSFKIIKPGD
jgi:tetratricopeptide (TPR) repeat protein